jgi:hypothetical protein
MAFWILVAARAMKFLFLQTFCEVRNKTYWKIPDQWWESNLGPSRSKTKHLTDWATEAAAQSWCEFTSYADNANPNPNPSVAMPWDVV